MPENTPKPEDPAACGAAEEAYRVTPEMDFGAYRAQFATVEAFRRHFGSLPEETVRGLIGRTVAGTTSKAGMISTWRAAREQLRKETGAQGGD